MREKKREKKRVIERGIKRARQMDKGRDRQTDRQSISMRCDGLHVAPLYEQRGRERVFQTERKL